MAPLDSLLGNGKRINSFDPIPNAFESMFTRACGIWYVEAWYGEQAVVLTAHSSA